MAQRLGLATSRILCLGLLPKERNVLRPFASMKAMGESQSSVPRPTPIAQNAATQGKLGFKCPHCSHVADSKPSMKGHIKKEHQMKPYSCTHCFKQFTNFREFQGHFRIHHPEMKSSIPKEPYETVPISLDSSALSVSPEIELAKPETTQNDLCNLAEILSNFPSRNLSLVLYPLKCDTELNYPRKSAEIFTCDLELKAKEIRHEMAKMHQTPVPPQKVAPSGFWQFFKSQILFLTGFSKK